MGTIRLGVSVRVLGRRSACLRRHSKQVGADLQTVHHEVHHGLPGGEAVVTQQGADVVEEGLARGQGRADEPIGVVAEGEEGVREQGEHVHGGEQRGEMFLAVAEVMLQMIALGFERVVVFVLDLPACAAGGDEGGGVLVGDRPVGDESIGSGPCRRSP